MKTINYFLLVCVSIITLQSCIVSGRPSIDYFKTKEIRKNNEFVSINIPTFLTKTLIKGKLKEDGHGKEVVKLVKKFSKIKIMASPSLKAKDISEFNSYLVKENFEDWASIKSDGDIISIKAKQKKDVIKNLMLVVTSNDSDAVIIDVSGSFTPEDISVLIDATEKKVFDFKINKS